MLNWLMRWWTRKQRHTDREILWPQLLIECRNRTNALRTFQMHMEIDPAYRGLSVEQKQAFLKELP